MRNLNLVINFSTPAHHSMAEFGTVDTRTGTNFDVILKNHAANMRHTNMLLAIIIKPEAFFADHCTGMNPHTPSKDTLVTDNRVGPDFTLITDRRTETNIDSGMNYRGCSNYDFLLDDDVWTDRTISSQTRRWIHNSRGVYSDGGPRVRDSKGPKQFGNSVVDFWA